MLDADEAVCIGGAAPSESYLRIDAIIGAAARTGADAIHPGYGFLAENAAFARACADAGVTFVGPTPEAIDAMGSKLAAKRMLADAGVPVLPDVEDPARAADEVGFPLLVKPSAGGGGKGMRIVRSASELDAAVAASKREAAGAFGDDTLLLERYVESGRHVEIQILGDTHGEVIHLGERECSIQRRHQKILEESPSVAVDEALRARMGEAAVAAGRAIGYVGAGTVEFLLGSDQQFYFLEVNTRLQVEHPVTEEVLGIDLVRAQLEIAAAATSRRCPHRAATRSRCACTPRTRRLISSPRPACSRTCGSPTACASMPASQSGSEISIHYDPMIAKVIAYAPTRSEAAAGVGGRTARGRNRRPEDEPRLPRAPARGAGVPRRRFRYRVPRAARPDRAAARAARMRGPAPRRRRLPGRRAGARRRASRPRSRAAGATTRRRIRRSSTRPAASSR